MGEVGGKFQQLRHAAIFRHSIVPRELELQATFAFDELFGHSRKIELTYAIVSLGRDESRTSAEDTTSTVRCLQAFWIALSILDRPKSHLRPRSSRSFTRSRQVLNPSTSRTLFSVNLFRFPKIAFMSGLFPTL